ncbi:MAG: S46 family peptidase [Rikenellaceae bacterium]|nr:S46 family peptidase [Rikenellaceae bacterium]
MKRLLITLLFAASTVGLAADEGMWLPSQIGQRIKDMKAKGFKLSADDIYNEDGTSLKDAIVLFGTGCTGEMVSPDGLLLTNHHCGYGAIQQHSSVEHDYLTNGFWAMNRDEELPNPGLTVTFLERMEDVTARVEAGEKPADIAKQASQGGKYSVRVEPLYYGNQYMMYISKVYRDVRLVGAPPSAVGKFGGDTDNWMWPRHTGDFSVFRVYADANGEPADYSKDNVPLKPKRYFKISTKGADEGDFTFVYGFPGTTQEYLISDAVAYTLNRANPTKIALRTMRLNVIKEASEADPKVRIQYAAKQARIANAWKKWQGESLGLGRLGTIATKQAYEAEFQRWANDKPEYAHLLDSMRTAYARHEDDFFRREFTAESIFAIEVVNFARWCSGRAGKELKAADKEYIAAFFKDYVQAIDRTTAKLMIAEYLKNIADAPAEWATEVRTAGVERWVDALYDNTALLDPSKVESLLADKESFNADVAVKFMQTFNTDYYRSKGSIISRLPDIARWYKPYLKALREWDTERAFYPDANLTLRVAYGKVAGYHYADGVYHRPYTTLDGIIEKDNPEIYDYNVPQALRDAYAAKDYGRWAQSMYGRTTVPVAFLAANHTTGGNSGSPILNAKGELLGLNFDRTWLSTMSDIQYDPEVCRNISVDIRYVLFFIDKIGGAGYLLDEMVLK